jgi:hypothetical protein
MKPMKRWAVKEIMAIAVVSLLAWSLCFGMQEMNVAEGNFYFVPPISIYIHSPTNGTTYNSGNILLNITDSSMVYRAEAVPGQNPPFCIK